MTDHEWLTEAQAAAALRIHPKTLARYRKAKRVACDRLPGGRIRYSWPDLIAFRSTWRLSADAPSCSHMSGESEAEAG
jgi:hypothetical protein